jgi:large subunit ribosomal protein L31e
MIREFAIHHMKSESVKIEEDVSHLIWARGIRHPPRKIRVKLTKDDDGTVLISKYQEEKPKKEEAVEKKPKQQKTEKTEEKPEEPKLAKPESVPEKKLETKEELKAKQEKPKKEQKSEKKSEEKTKTKSNVKRKKK